MPRHSGAALKPSNHAAFEVGSYAFTGTGAHDGTPA